MFESALLDSSRAAKHRGWTTLVSLILQALGIGFLLLLPLFSRHALPAVQQAGRILAAPVATGAPELSDRRTTVAGAHTEVTFDAAVIRAPRRIPNVIDMRSDVPSAPPPMTGADIPGAIRGEGLTSPLIADILNRPAVIAASRPAVRVPVSTGVAQGYLIRRVDPSYPRLAVLAGVQGSVILAAVISRDGRVENLRVLSGHPMLVEAALQAVQQWRYRPYYLNGEPVEVETQITVNFTLSRGQ